MLQQIACFPKFTQLRKLSYGKLKSWYSGLVKRPPLPPPYRHIVQIGDPCLRVVSDTVPLKCIKELEMQFVIERLKTIFKQYNCVGISAPQIGINWRIVIVEFNKKHAKKFTSEELQNKDMNYFPLTVKHFDHAVVINPELKVLDYTKVTHWEACVSVKGFWADVTRYQEVEVRGFNENGEPISLNAKGWPARIFQHELDHLNGKLYTDIMDRKTLTCSCWEVVNERRGKVELPFSY